MPRAKITPIRDVNSKRASELKLMYGTRNLARIVDFKEDPNHLFCIHWDISIAATEIRDALEKTSAKLRQYKLPSIEEGKRDLGYGYVLFAEDSAGEEVPRTIPFDTFTQSQDPYASANPDDTDIGLVSAFGDYYFAVEDGKTLATATLKRSWMNTHMNLSEVLADAIVRTDARKGRFATDAEERIRDALNTYLSERGYPAPQRV